MVEIPVAQQRKMRAITGTPMGIRAASHKDAADQALKLTKEEKNLYDHHLDNLSKGGVQNADGSTSTLYAFTAQFDGKSYVIPTVWGNEIVSGDTAVANAKAEGLENFPSYPTDREAHDRYMQIHDYMEKDLPPGS
jgi:hypothetical protein